MTQHKQRRNGMGNVEGMDGQIVTGEVITPAPEAPKAKKPRKARATSKFIVIPAEMLKLEDAMPNLVSARKRAESLGMNGTFYIACLREEVTVETITPVPVTKVAVKRVTR
jgi:hypothetical protein